MSAPSYIPNWTYVPPTATPSPLPLGAGFGTGASSLPYAASTTQLPLTGGVPLSDLPFAAGGAEGVGAEVATGGRLAGLLGRVGGVATNPIFAIPAASYVAAGAAADYFARPQPAPPTTTAELIDRLTQDKAAVGSDQIPGWAKADLAKQIAASPLDQVVTAAKDNGFTPDQINQLVQPLQRATSPDQVKSLTSQILDQVIPQAVQARTQDAAAVQQQHQQAYLAHQQEASDQQFALALQAQATQFMQPYIQQIVQGGDAEASALSSLAGQVPAGMRGVFQQQATLARTGAYKLAGAYAAQAAYGGGFLQQIQQSRAAQQTAQVDYEYKQALTQEAMARAALAQAQAANGGTSGSQSFDQIAQQQQTTG